MKIAVVKAVKPYKPDCGDLVCCATSAQYLETPPNKFPQEQVLPLAAIRPNPWMVLEYLGIDASLIRGTYECPYTGYDFYGVVPICLASEQLDKYCTEEMKQRGQADYWFDHAWHVHMMKDRRFDLTEVQRLLLGSGYTDMTGHHDGSGSKKQTKVNLENGDYLWVWFNEWHNK